MTHPAPVLFTGRPDALLVDQWAVRVDGRPRAVRLDTVTQATHDRWHAAPVALADIRDLDLLADWYGDRDHRGYTITVGVGASDQAALYEAAQADRVDLAVRVDVLPHRFLLTRMLDRTRVCTPQQMRGLVAAALADGHGDRRAHPQG
jgi:hypothetical protein